MLDIRSIREDADTVRARLATKGVDPALIDVVVANDAERRSLLTEVEQLKGERNRVSKEIGALKREGKDTSEIQAQTRALGEKIGSLDLRVREVDMLLNDSNIRLSQRANQALSAAAYCYERGEKDKATDFSRRATSLIPAKADEARQLLAEPANP